MKSMSTTSLRRCWLSSHLLPPSTPSRSSFFCFPSQSPVGRPAQPPNRLCYSSHLVRSSSLHYSFILAFQILCFSAFGSKIHRQRIRPNSEVQADVDHGDHSLFHKCQELSKVMSFLEKSVRLAQTILLVWQNAYRQLNVVFLQRS
jgi:hypothetical protein